MSKWYPISVATSLVIGLLATIYLFFSGLQLVVFIMNQWTDSWAVVALLGSWMFVCVYGFFFVLEFLQTKAKLHFSEA